MTNSKTRGITTRAKGQSGGISQPLNNILNPFSNSRLDILRSSTRTAIRASSRTSSSQNNKFNSPRTEVPKERQQRQAQQVNNRKQTKIEQANEVSKQRRMRAKVKRTVKLLLQKQQGGNELTQKECDLAYGLCYAANDWNSLDTVLEAMKKGNIQEEKSTYTTCLSECYRSGNGISALKMFKRMESSTVKPDVEDVQFAVLSLCRNNRYEAGLWRKACGILLAYANKKKNIHIDSYNAVLNCMEEENCWEDSIHLLSVMENKATKELSYYPTPTLSTYHAVLNGLAKASKAKEAMDLLQSMTDKGVLPTVYTFEIVLPLLLKKRDQWHTAIDLLDTMHESKVTAPTVFYNRVISTCARAGQIGATSSLFVKMKSRRIQPDTVTYNSLISATANKGRAKEALRLLDDCKKEKGVEVDIITYTNTIRACARGRMSAKALDLLDEVKENGLPLDAYIYSSVIDACAKGKMWRKALDLLEDMKKFGIIPNEFTYSAAINACGSCGQWERALELLNQMREKDMQISAITYNSAITALAKAARSNARRSTKTFISKESESGGISPRSIEGGIDEEQLWRKALGLIDQMKQERLWPDVYSYSSAINACNFGGRFEEALKLIKIMQKGHPKSRPNKVAYTGAISACARSGEWAPALQLFVDMKADQIQCDKVSYNALLNAYMNGGQAKMAYDVWNEMCQGGERSNISPDIVTLTTVIATLDRGKGKDDESRMDSVFAEAVKRQIILPKDSMDTLWEIDLSGMSLPVSRAACRFIIHRLEKCIKEQGEECQDLNLITGVGKHHSQAGKKSGEDEDDLSMLTSNETGNGGSEISTPPSSQFQLEIGKNSPGTTALREFVREVLREDFEIYSTIPNNAAGTVQVKKEMIERWISSQS